MLRKIVPTGIISATLASLPAFADDGYISSGGNPHLMHSHSTVAMQSEVVLATIDDNKVSVDCSFVFKNDGEACKVRMGFPDMGIPPSPKGSFRSYKSFVDDVEVPTEGVAGDKNSGEFWHAKFVDFPSQSVRKVRDVYSDIEGGFSFHEHGLMSTEGGVHMFNYILHTASSWKGPIEDGIVEIKFNTLPGPPMPVDAQKTHAAGKSKYWRAASPSTVVYSGPCAPTVSDKSLIFHFQNLRPNEMSDISVLYGFVPREPELDEKNKRKTKRSANSR